MGILRWLKVQYYEPQYNKTLSLIGHYRKEISLYSQNANDDRGIKRATYDNAVKALAVWEHKSEQLLVKLERARRS